MRTWTNKAKTDSENQSPRGRLPEGERGWDYSEQYRDEFGC